MGSPGQYEVVSGTIAFAHGVNGNRHNPTGFFNYHWVKDHVNIAADVGSNCEDMERSLRYAMPAILGSGANDQLPHRSPPTSCSHTGKTFFHSSTGYFL
jgi:hypothetical protein